jgi:hypothetical protein
MFDSAAESGDFLCYKEIYKAGQEMEQKRSWRLGVVRNLTAETQRAPRKKQVRVDEH